MTGSVTYKRSGVDIDRTERFLGSIKGLVASTRIRGSTPSIGGFGAFFDLSNGHLKRPLLVASADGVGTKLKIAALCNLHHTIGIDLVAMNVNDVLVSGARPLFLLDYISTSKVNPKILKSIVKGIVSGCRRAGCALIGGETAEMPGMYKKGEYDLAAFCVGVVEKDKAIDGSKVRAGDAVIGIASSGLHANGYSLVRRIFSERELKRRQGELLRPTRIYVRPVLDIISRFPIKAIANITGGGFIDNIPRVLPSGLRAKIRKGSWPVPEIFSDIERKAGISGREAFRTFNMGIGMVLIVGKTYTDSVMKRFSRFNLKSYNIGEIVKGSMKRKSVVEFVPRVGACQFRRN